MRRHGFILVVCLLLLSLFLLGGMAMMGQRAAQYRGAAMLQKLARARALAEAGLEDFRVKLQKDQNFPPPGDQHQNLFTYSEIVTDMANNRVGHYTVTVDSRYRTPSQPPDPESPSVVLATSVGALGSDRLRPEAVYALRLEVDVDDEFLIAPNPPAVITDLQEITDFLAR